MPADLSANAAAASPAGRTIPFAMDFDVIVVGGGHAGTEAAAAAARLGARTLLLTQSLATIGQMSCNPAIGGIGKGHLAREIDALDGLMARAADRAGIHFRTLNASKGPAVRATRAQADRTLYRAAIRALLNATPGLELRQASVDDLALSGGRVTGVVTDGGQRLTARAVVLTVGTFLAGRMHVGLSQSAGGRAGDPPSNALAARLRELAPRVGRLKTGTPPRIDGNTVDFSVLERQPGDEPRPVFSFLGSRRDHPRQVACHITRTTEETHALIRAALHRSPLYTGVIEGVGPRYCPSVEDKVVRFADKASHQVFLEPEGLDTAELYPNGISTSLPADVQVELVRSLPGCARAELTRPGYAIEYDYFDPRDLAPTLESRALPGLYLAGQINGTTGYEEAAAQGLLAGLNAGRAARDHEPWFPTRDQAYLGVLVDDLITRGVTEPYRMFTSRAEHRLELREDNADQRLTPAGRELGLVGEARWAAYGAKQDAIATERARLAAISLRPEQLPAGSPWDQQPLRQPVRALDLLRRPGVDHAALCALPAVGAPAGVRQRVPRAADTPGAGADTGAETGCDDEGGHTPDDALAEAVTTALEVEARYAGYLGRARDEIERARRNDSLALPADLDYGQVHGLSMEIRQRLGERRPATLGQASRLPGVTPAAVSTLLVHLKKGRLRRG